KKPGAAKAAAPAAPEAAPAAPEGGAEAPPTVTAAAAPLEEATAASPPADAVDYPFLESDSVPVGRSATEPVGQALDKRRQTAPELFAAAPEASGVPSQPPPFGRSQTVSVADGQATFMASRPMIRAQTIQLGQPGMVVRNDSLRR
ncbi:unnamed protein product, partial [Prorocentrum cordatum]